MTRFTLPLLIASSLAVAALPATAHLVTGTWDDCGGTAPQTTDCNTGVHLTVTGFVDHRVAWAAGYHGHIVSILDGGASVMECAVDKGAGNCWDETGASVGSCGGTGGGCPGGVVLSVMFLPLAGYSHACESLDFTGQHTTATKLGGDGDWECGTLHN